jgi:hypothetical protein
MVVILEYETRRSAVFGGPDDCYRYELRRWWGTGPLVSFVGLNPSTADASVDDPTIRRCCGFARAWNFDGVIMVNMFGYRATDPRKLLLADFSVGPENDVYLRRAAEEASRIVVCWGTWGGPSGRRDFADPSCREPVVAVLNGLPMMCLGRTKDGSPRHPLYLRSDTPCEPFRDLVAA